MRRRWIIRSFFIGLLLLFVAGWLGSYEYEWGVSYQGRNLWSVGCNWGKIYLDWLGLPGVRPNGWHADIYAAAAARDLREVELSQHHLLGFHITMRHRETYIAVPYWFPTTLSAAILWLVWRKTRPRAKGRAFPVELGKPTGEQASEAK